MNSLLRVLQSLDDCRIERDKAGKITVHWVHPYDRERNRQIDLAAVDRLVAANYLEWWQDGSTSQLLTTDRGQVLVMRYRPLSYRGYPVYPVYLDFACIADRLSTHYRSVSQ